MKQNLRCNIALFALTETPRIQAHWSAGGLVSYLENDFIVVQRGNDKNYLAQVSHIPIAFKGSASCMIKNILPAVLAGVISNISFTDIESALYDFLPTAENLPGRRIFSISPISK
ncbi:hypothetical protein [Legionella sp. km772]|uniref:hypothetical protein n=1 Tax=Legionella sp. km772 TaxID=2498111 RepID=UPI000F8E0007|nr:hypothetical protein [Legionella sp. km772]RUR07136.1 hypothetical protein ELY15_12515 [Legionella sp. km772]